VKNQDIERRYFEKFRKVYPLPPGEVEYDDKPDVRIKGLKGELILGIEITNFYTTEGTSSASEQVQSGLRKTAVAEGHRLYSEDGGKNIELTFNFDKRFPIRDVKRLATQLAALARRIENNDNGAVMRNVFQDIRELDFVYLYARELQYTDEPDPAFPNGCPDLSEDSAAWMEYRNRREARALRKGVYKPLKSKAKWKVTQGHDFGLMSVTRLAEIIREKEVKAQRYVACDAYWLLIIVDFINAAQEQEIRIDGLTAESTVFKKIIVYKPGFEHIVEIAPHAVDSTAAPNGG